MRLELVEADVGRGEVAFAEAVIHDDRGRIGCPRWRARAGEQQRRGERQEARAKQVGVPVFHGRVTVGFAYRGVTIRLRGTAPYLRSRRCGKVGDVRQRTTVIMGRGRALSDTSG